MTTLIAEDACEAQWQDHLALEDNVPADMGLGMFMSSESELHASYPLVPAEESLQRPLLLSDPENAFAELENGRDGNSKNSKTDSKPISTVREVLSFVDTRETRALFVIGCLLGVASGAVYPVFAHLFSNSFSDLSTVRNAEGLEEVRRLALSFVILGAFAFVCMSIQTSCFEIIGARASQSFRAQWFAALLRQDATFFDLNDVAGIASTIEPNSVKVRQGLGRRFGEGIQFSVTVAGGIGYAFYVSWKNSLLMVAFLPVSAIVYLTFIELVQTRSFRASEAYFKAGSVAYGAISAMRTVSALNAAPEMIRQYAEATLEAFESAVSMLLKEGFFFGLQFGTILFGYAVMTLFGAFLLYRDVADNGCDPSGGVEGNVTCASSGADIVGSFFGILYGTLGIAVVGNFVETFTTARSACYPAMSVIHRRVGAESAVFADDANGKPEDIYVIDSSSTGGLAPDNIRGSVTFKNVSFSYPARPDSTVLSDFNLEIEAGTTVALVGDSGEGKSTVMALIERLYDPISGSVTLDGYDLRSLNVKHLRSHVRHVRQEPELFAATISENIRYGASGITQADVESAARLANAHDFITSFPDGYNTYVGDGGEQLSGGQKQRVAIARALVANAKVLLLDEATSALDSESERLVRDSLDNVLSGHKRTVLVIAHRLTTIRNADVIAVVKGGRIVEKGHHDELMKNPIGHYRNMVETQISKARGSPCKTSSTAGPPHNGASSLPLNSGIEVVTHDGYAPTTDASGDKDCPPIRFDNVSFAYPIRPDATVLNSFSLSVSRGETLALVGPSGDGKTTVLSMLERFYDPSDGVIQYEGVDLKLLNVKWLRDKIGYVSQEPTLFNTTIGRNIAHGFPKANQKDIESAAILANAHDFIISFPDGYDTMVGQGGAQLSGGEKQRIAIARALVKNPSVLLLDEATSALDRKSEEVVQRALDKLLASNDRTTIVIAHRLSTIRNADRIAFVKAGTVREAGTHELLMERPDSLYRHLVETQVRGADGKDTALQRHDMSSTGEEEARDKKECTNLDEETLEHKKDVFNFVRELVKPDMKLLLAGAVGALFAGSVFPICGILYGLMIDLLFQPVLPCPGPTGVFDPRFFESDDCSKYIDRIYNSMKQTSFKYAGYWCTLAVLHIAANTVVFYSLGKASEHLNKRLRDACFEALVRQEIAFFDKCSVNNLTTRLETDAAKIQAFSGEPIRMYLMNMASVLIGVIVSLVYMWPFALLSIATIPLMGLSYLISIGTSNGEDEGNDVNENQSSPGGIAVETLLKMKTVSSLSLEDQRYNDYVEAMRESEPHLVVDSIKIGCTNGLSILVEQWVRAFQFWWGGWILFNHRNLFSFQDFVISLFSLLFSRFALGSSVGGVTDWKEAEQSARRIFHLLNRESRIDPLSKDGLTLD